MARITPQEAILRLKPSPTRGRFMAPALNLQSSLTFDKAVGEEELLYIINNEDTGESYLCPADDKLTPVIGAWDSYSNNEDIPPAMIEWIECQEEEIRLWLQYELLITTDDADQLSGYNEHSNKYNDGEGLLEGNQWNQKSPYNSKHNIKTNIDSSLKHYWPVGCPGMSLSQIAYYWGNKKGYEIGCPKVETYNRKSNFIENGTLHSGAVILVYVDLPKVDNFDFLNMADSVTKSNNAICTLTLYATLTVRSLPLKIYHDGPNQWRCTYTSTGASLSDLFEGVLRFGFNNIEALADYTEVVNSKTNTTYKIGDTVETHFTVTYWNDIIERIKTEIQNKCPVIISGYTENGGGHTWVCDGYKEVNNIKYGHFNWGWGNCYNGYFMLTDLSPAAGLYNYQHASSDGNPANSEYLLRRYNRQRSAIVGIYPDEYQPDTTIYGDVNKDGTIDDADVIQAVKDVYSGNYSEEGDIDKDGIFSEKDIEGVYDRVTNPNNLSTKINYVYKIKRLTNDIVNTLLDINTNLRQK